VAIRYAIPAAKSMAMAIDPTHVQPAAKAGRKRLFLDTQIPLAPVFPFFFTN
jgi:hypothetical protein